MLKEAGGGPARRSALVAAALLIVGLVAVVVAVAGPADDRQERFRIGPRAQDPCGPPVLKANGRPWRCTFAEDFDGNELDPDRWQVLTTFDSGGRKPECRVDDPDNVRLGDGFLHLSAVLEPRPVRCRAQDGPYVTRKSAGAVTTSRRFAQTYGRVEVVAAMPAYRGVGFHSALWMFPQSPHYGRWPASGEIDIVEYRTGLYGHPVPTVHWLERGEHELVTNYRCTVPDPEEFHAYVLEWSAVGMRFVFDGEVCLVVRFDQDRHPRGRPYDRPFFVILNQSHGIGHNQRDGRTPSSATMRVDSVRSWR